MRETNIKTLGCKLNIYESEAIRVLCKNENLNDATIINTCSVTAEAVKKAKKSVRKAHRADPEKLIVVTGCAAQTEPETFSNMQEVDLVVGNAAKLSPITWRNLRNKTAVKPPQKIHVNDIMKVSKLDPVPISNLGKRTRAYVQIQNGCDHRCTFCIIPYGRGNSRSVTAKSIINQIQKLVGNGFQEVVLTGVDITAWGNDLISRPNLGTLVKQILNKVPNLFRLRLSSIDSIEVDEKLSDIILNEPRFMPHLHLSLQSGDNLILKRMKRRHSREAAIRFCNMVQDKRPEMTFGGDIIAGFPTETEKMFKNSLSLISECNLTWLHIFPFSARQGTPASRMPQVSSEKIKFRAKKLRELAKLQVIKHLEFNVGKIHSILIEGKGIGRTESFAEVIVSPNLKPGKIESLFVESHNDLQLISRNR